MLLFSVMAEADIMLIIISNAIATYLILYRTLSRRSVMSNLYDIKYIIITNTFFNTKNGL